MLLGVEDRMQTYFDCDQHINKSKRKQFATLQLVNGLRPFFHKLALRKLLLLLRALCVSHLFG